MTSEESFEIIDWWESDKNAQPGRQRGEGGAIAKVRLSDISSSPDWTAVLIFSQNVENFSFYSWNGAVSKVSGNKVTIINR